MSFRKLAANAMSALGLSRELADLANNTFHFRGAATPGANGNVSIAHGLGVAPTFYAAGIAGMDGAATGPGCHVESVDATNVVLRIFNTTSGADITSGAHQVWVMASSKL